MSVIVAVDGGQSQCRVAVSADGAVTATCTTAGLSYAGDPGGVRTVTGLLDFLQDYLAPQLTGRPAPTFVLALTGMPSATESRSQIAAAVAARYRPVRQLISSDLPAAFAGAVGLQAGAVISAGSGTIALGLDGTGGAHRVGGGGAMLGDDGSAYWIGLQGLREAWRARTGRSGSADLLSRAAQRYDPVSGLPGRLLASRNPVSVIAEFAVDVVAASDAGDDAAAGILRQAASHLADILCCAAEAATARQGRPEPRLAMSWSGRLLHSAALHDLFAAAVRHRLPWARVLPPEGTALDGAVLLGTAPDLNMMGDQVTIADSAGAITPDARR